MSALGMQTAKLPFLSLPYIRKRYFLSLLILVCFPGMGYTYPFTVLLQNAWCFQPISQAYKSECTAVQKTLYIPKTKGNWEHKKWCYNGRRKNHKVAGLLRLPKVMKCIHSILRTVGMRDHTLCQEQVKKWSHFTTQDYTVHGTKP